MHIRRYRVAAAALTIAAASLAGAGSAAASGATSSAPRAAAASTCGYTPPQQTNQIALVDQGPNSDNSQVIVMDQNADWKTAAPVWTSGTLLQKSADWGHLTDAKFRLDSNGVKVVLVTAGNGYVGSIDYARGTMIWQVDLHQGGAEVNPHSIELLPNGAVVVADTKGKLWFFAYGSHTAVPYDLPGAHAVLYNDCQLWAAGDGILRQYNISATGLTKVNDMSMPPAFNLGHDLEPMTDNPRHMMWVSGSNHVYLFDKYAGGSTPAPVEVTGAPYDTDCVKAIGTTVDQTVVEVRKSGCTGSIYLTDTVDLYPLLGLGAPRHLVKPGGAFYKARPVTWSYY